jgi:hypothetical protein
MKAKEIAGLVIKGVVIVAGALLGGALLTPVADEAKRIILHEDDEDETF